MQYVCVRARFLSFSFLAAPSIPILWTYADRLADNDGDDGSVGVCDFFLIFYF